MVQVERNVECLVEGTHEEQKDPVLVVELQQPIGALSHLLVAGRAAHDLGVDVDVVGGKVQGDQRLPRNEVVRVQDAQKDNQRTGGASVRHHVQHGAELRRLVELPGVVPVEGVKQARRTVKKAHCDERVVGHREKRQNQGYHPSISNEIGDEVENHLGSDRRRDFCKRYHL